MLPNLIVNAVKRGETKRTSDCTSPQCTAWIRAEKKAIEESSRLTCNKDIVQHDLLKISTAAPIKLYVISSS